jgi:hypothetical protein
MPFWVVQLQRQVYALQGQAADGQVATCALEQQNRELRTKLDAQTMRAADAGR